MSNGTIHFYKSVLRTPLLASHVCPIYVKARNVQLFGSGGRRDTNLTGYNVTA